MIYDYTFNPIDDDELLDWNEVAEEILVLGDNDPTIKRMENVAFKHSDKLIVVCHGHYTNNFTYRIFDDSETCVREGHVTTENVARLIKARPSWEEGKEIILLSCFSGVDGTGSLAQDLADLLDTKVLAPAGNLFISPEGDLIVQPEWETPYNEQDVVVLDDYDGENFWFPFYGPSWSVRPR